MAEELVQFFLFCVRNYLFIETNPSGCSTYLGYYGIIFNLVNAFHYFAVSTMPKSDLRDVILGNHFGEWGGTEVLWSLVMLQAALMYFIISTISFCCKHKSPENMAMMAIPLKDFMERKVYRSRYYKFMLFVLRISGVLTIVIGSTIDVFAFMRNPIFQECFSSLIISSFWSFALAGTGYFYILILGTVAICVDIMSSLLREEFKALRESLTRNLKRKRLRQFHCIQVIKKFNLLCSDLHKYDSHWKRILFTIVVISTTFLACALHLFLFTSLPPVLMYGGLTVTLAAVAFFSFCLLSPASVCSAARDKHSKFCSLMTRTERLPLYTKVKLLYTIKRFQKPIAFTLWDSNHIDSFDYFNVSFLMLY